MAPRISMSQEGVWADGHGLNARALSESLLDVILEHGIEGARAGISYVPVAAQVAAQFGRGSIVEIKVGEEQQYIAEYPAAVLSPSSYIANLLTGVGIKSCDDIARLSRESVEVRFGSEGVRLWRLARADDARLIFAPMPRALPHASLDWVDYVVRDAERLLFVINALLNTVCTSLHNNGEGTREMLLAFSLANRRSCEHPIRIARPTASQKNWLRHIRLELERIKLPDAVTGISLAVESVAAIQGKQGDIFDRGFATARATEEAVAQILDDYGNIIVAPEDCDHPLLDRRTEWVDVDAMHAVQDVTTVTSPNPRLALQLFDTPRRIQVVTGKFRNYLRPLKYRDKQWHDLLKVSMPQDISGEWWTSGKFNRVYFQCVDSDGKLLWIFHDTGSSVWYLHGWWN